MSRSLFAFFVILLSFNSLAQIETKKDIAQGVIGEDQNSTTNWVIQENTKGDDVSTLVFVQFRSEDPLNKGEVASYLFSDSLELIEFVNLLEGITSLESGVSGSAEFKFMMKFYTGKIYSLSSNNLIYVEDKDGRYFTMTKSEALKFMAEIRSNYILLKN